MKKFGIFTLALVSLTLSACSGHLTRGLNPGDPPSTHSLDGTWEFLPTAEISEEAHWKTIEVPANWYKQGFDISGKAHYKKRFFIASKLQGKQFNLIFKGVDYFADVWLNGEHLGSHEGYFQQFSFDATAAIKWGAENELHVIVDSPLESEENYSLHKRLIKGIFAHHDTRPGGAWSDRGQERNTGGIWDSVEFHISDNVFIKHLKSVPKPLGQQRWQLETELDLQGALPDGAEFHWALKAKNHEGAMFSGVSQSASFLITVDNPRLWWPIGFGKPHLYELDVQIKHQGKTIEQIQTTTAFRQVELTEDRIWKINGQRILLLGTNYIASQWLSEMSPRKIARDIKLMKKAGINSVRVHAHVMSREFYEMSDENGLMIWQDFPLQWGYQDTEEFGKEAESQLADMLNQYANHPSIIHWTLHNEPPWDADWMKWKYPDYSPDQNKSLDEALYQFAIGMEKLRPVTMHSATQEHPWLGWYSGHWLDYAKPTTEAFIAEYGAQALPKKSILKKILKGNIDLPEISEAERKGGWKAWSEWSYHNFQPLETFDNAKVEAGENAQSLIDNTQAYQAQLLQLAAESYRRQAYQPVSALFQFMFVEDWESMNWGIVDYWRNAKPGYHSLKMAYQAILPSLEWSKIEYPEGEVSVGLWVLNDTPDAYRNISYEIELLKDGKRIDEKTYTVRFSADFHQEINRYHTPELSAGGYQIRASLVDESGKVLGYNKYTFTVI